MTREGMTVPNTSLCEKLVSDDNLTKAAKKVRVNDGAPGVDRILAEDALVFFYRVFFRNHIIEPTTDCSRFGLLFWVKCSENFVPLLCPFR